MCGIVGVAALEGPLSPAVAEALPAMATALRHRGPDAQGVWTCASAGLGHRRLSIIDRAGGAQPMSNEDGSVWIAFNGEVYNHPELRRELSTRGHVFRTRSDTEAIIHAYEEWGAACVERLEGMFAFAIYDERRRELFAARDRLGKKPLFYACLGGVLHFASEMKAIAASPLWDGAIDLDALEGYLSLGYFIAPMTVYRHVRKLEPGCWLRLRNGALETRRYWDVERFGDDRRPPHVVLDELDAMLAERVRERLESEVPLGAFLSGGIDSGLVVAYMAEAQAAPVVTTTVGFGARRDTELAAAALTARRFRTDHHPEIVEPRLEEVLDPIVDAFDEPFADASAIPTYYVSAMARRHVTVALSGDGGDESFAGYDFRYVPHALEGMAARLIPGIGRRAAAWLARRWPRSPRLPKPLRLATVFDNLSRDPVDAYYLDLCFLKPREARLLLGRDPDGDPRASPVYEAVTAPYRRCPGDAVLKAQYADLKVYLPNDVLVKVDRMSMQHSLEVRSPLLDRRVVELAFSLPTRIKMPRLRGKHLLRVLARRRLPQRLSTLPKRGFDAPIASWLRGPAGERFEADCLSATSFVRTALDAPRLQALLDAHRAGSSNHGYALWATWMLERWARARVTPA